MRPDDEFADDDDMVPVEEEFKGTALFAGTDNPARYDLGEFRRLHEPLIQRHERLLRWHYGFSDRLLRLLLDAVKLVEQRPEAAVTQGTFLLAFLMLAAKIVSHAESIRMLTGMGRYGDAAGLCRFGLSDGMMLRYLAVFPEDVGDWFDLSQLRTPVHEAGKRYKALANKFREGTVRKKLLEGSVTVRGSALSDLSEAAHPTVWGMQYYSDMAPGGVFHIHYAPFYDPLPKAQALALFLILVLYEPIDVFVAWCTKQAFDWHEPVETRWVALRVQVEKFVRMALAALDAGMDEFFPRE